MKYEMKMEPTVEIEDEVSEVEIDLLGNQAEADALVKPIKPDYLIDIHDQDELNYIATKLGCSVNDILEATETLKSYKRSKIYTWLIDKAFKAQYNK